MEPDAIRSLPDDALADEIAYALDVIGSTRDMKLRRKWQQKLAELYGEQGRRSDFDTDFPIPRIA